MQGPDAEGDDGKGIYGFSQEVIAREAAETPLRRARLIAYGVFGFTAVVLGGVSLAGLAGVEDVKELGQNLPNPLLDAAVLGLAFYLWVEEVSLITRCSGCLFALPACLLACLRACVVKLFWLISLVAYLDSWLVGCLFSCLVAWVIDLLPSWLDW